MFGHLQFYGLEHPFCAGQNDVMSEEPFLTSEISLHCLIRLGKFFAKPNDFMAVEWLVTLGYMTSRKVDAHSNNKLNKICFFVNDFSSMV